MGRKERKKRKARGGRPRKSGPRYPSGDLKREVAQAVSVVGSSSISPVAVHRIREFGRAFALDPKLGTELGRLLLLEQVTTLEAAAGWRLAETYRRFERQHGRRRAAKSPGYELGLAGAALSDESPDDAQGPFLALQKQFEIYGSHARNAVETLCVDDQPISPAVLADVRAILARLGKEHFQMQAAVMPAGARRPPGSGPGLDRTAGQAIAERSRKPIKGHADGALVLAEILRDVMPRDEVLEVLAFARAVRDRARFRERKEREARQ